MTECMSDNNYQVYCNDREFILNHAMSRVIVNICMCNALSVRTIFVFRIFEFEPYFITIYEFPCIRFP